MKHSWKTAFRLAEAGLCNVRLPRHGIGAGQTELLPQYREQRRLWPDLDIVGNSFDRDARHDRPFALDLRAAEDRSCRIKLAGQCREDLPWIGFFVAKCARSVG